MIKDVLSEIKNLGHISSTVIGRKLNLSEGMVDGMIIQLINMKYISEDLAAPICSGKCSGCAKSNCNLNPIKTFTITEKGRKLLEN